MSRGSWNATAFIGFCPRGRPDPGTQGGVLTITVTLSPNKGEPVTGVTMTVTCRVGSGCNAGDEGVSVTGVAGFADFVEHTRGAILFHLN